MIVLEIEHFCNKLWAHHLYLANHDKTFHNRILAVINGFVPLFAQLPGLGSANCDVESP